MRYRSSSSDISKQTDWETFRWMQPTTGSQYVPNRTSVELAALDVKAEVQNSVYWACVCDWSDIFFTPKSP